jgi:hypothetical protein
MRQTYTEDAMKIAAFIARYGVTVIPPVGSPELCEVCRKRREQGKQPIEDQWGDKGGYATC